MKMKKPVRMPLRRPPARPRSATPLRARATTAEEDYDVEDYEGGEEPNMKFSHALIVVLVLHLVAVGGVFSFNWMKARQTSEATSPKQAAVTNPPPSPDAVAKSTAPASIDGWNGKVHTVAAGDTLTRIAALHGTTVEAIERENGITTYSMIRVGQVLKIPASTKTTAAKKTDPAPAKSTASSSAAAKQAFIAAKTGTAPVKATVISAVPKAQGVESAKSAAETPPAVAEDGIYVVVKGDNPYSIAKRLSVSYNELLSINDIKDPTKIQIGQKLKIPKKKN
jgi:LysM repeat protein